MSLIVHSLTKSYANTIAVDQLSFVIQPGEIVGFLGPNGAGKSTTLKMIAGIIPSDAGTIQIDGVSMNPSNVVAKRKVGFLSESNPLYLDLYVKEYLTFIANVHQIKAPEKKIKDTIELLQLDAMQSKKIGSLSKGYKQRVGIAAAILHHPSLILLDEPTSGLDPNQLLEIRSIIKMLSLNAMVLFSSHILQEVSAICSRALIINKGSLIADRNMDTLLNTESNHIHVIFEDDITAYKELLSQLAIQVAFIDKHTLVIQSDQDIDSKKLIMQFAIDNGLNIRQLHVEQASLEEIFKLLTHSKK